MGVAPTVNKLDDFFNTQEKRPQKQAYILAFQKTDATINDFLFRLYKASTTCGISIENKLENPSNEQINYLNTTITSNFHLDKAFISTQCQKWLQTLNVQQANALSEAMYSVCMDLKAQGKNEGNLKNAYVKFMCWLYYRFRSVLNQIGKYPKIIYEGSLSNYELYMLEMMRRCGCDVVILNGDFTPKITNDAMCPVVWPCNGTIIQNGTFVSGLKKQLVAESKLANVCGPKSSYTLCRNAWMESTDITELIKTARHGNRNMMCSSLIAYAGANDRNQYANTLYTVYNEIATQNRPVQINNNCMPMPTPQEIAAIKRQNCNNQTDLIMMAIQNVDTQDIELTKYAKYAWIDYIKSIPYDGRNTEQTIIKQLALFKRYLPMMSIAKPGCLFVMQLQNLTAFDYQMFDLLSRFPMDVVIINPQKLTDAMPESVLSIVYDDPIQLNEFPTEKLQATLRTTAYNARQDMDTMLYGDGTVFRDRQYTKADPVFLQTMYEEIEILWNEELNVRPGFNTTNDTVTIPTLFAKVCGVKDGNQRQYVKSIEKLVKKNKNVLYIYNKFPSSFRLNSNSITSQQSQWGNSALNGIQTFFGYNSKAMDQYYRNGDGITNVAQIMENGKVNAQKFKSLPGFPYSYMREATVDYMIDRFAYFLESKAVAGIGKNGAENIALKIFMNLPKQIVTMIQNFDFTKINPKIVYVNTTESILSLEQTILLQYLAFVGFDIIMFVPTGYNVVEKYLDKKLFNEFQIGEYLYDMRLSIKP